MTNSIKVKEKYSIEKKFNSFMKKIVMKLKSLKIYDTEEIEFHDGSSYEGFWSHTIGSCSLSKVLPLDHIFSLCEDYEDPNFSNKELDVMLRNHLNDLIDSFKKDRQGAWDSEDFWEIWDEYLSYSFYEKYLQVQLRHIRDCNSDEQEKYKKFKYLIYVQAFLNAEYSYAGEMHEDIVIPVKVTDLKSTYEQVEKAIDFLYEDYIKIGEDF